MAQALPVGPYLAKYGVGSSALRVARVLDDDRADGWILPLGHELSELVELRLADVIVGRVRERGDLHRAAALRSPEFHCFFPCHEADEALLLEASLARKHPWMWSLTTPTFCMNAYTLVGPMKR